MRISVIGALLCFLIAGCAPCAPHVVSPKHPIIVVLWEGPVGEVAAQTILSRITELGHPARIVALPWEGTADLKLYVKTNLNERVAKSVDPNTKNIDEFIVTDTTIDIYGEDMQGLALLQQHLNHPFAIRINAGLGEAARNLMGNHLLEFEKKFEVALKNLPQE